jgi:hypothetical protein
MRRGGERKLSAVRRSSDGRAGLERRCPIPVAGSEGVVATRSRRNLSVSPREVCWAPARLTGRPEDEEDDG